MTKTIIKRYDRKLSEVSVSRGDQIQVGDVVPYGEEGFPDARVVGVGELTVLIRRGFLERIDKIEARGIKIGKMAGLQAIVKFGGLLAR